MSSCVKKWDQNFILRKFLPGTPSGQIFSFLYLSPVSINVHLGGIGLNPKNFTSKESAPHGSLSFVVSPPIVVRGHGELRYRPPSKNETSTRFAWCEKARGSVGASGLKRIKINN